MVSLVDKLMINKETEQSIQTYINDLTHALSGQDLALIQDAVIDAELHFRAALNDTQTQNSSIKSIIENYGSAEETAQTYRDMESTVSFAFNGKVEQEQQQKSNHFYSILTETAVYPAVVFNFLSLPLGIIYFAWTVFVGVTSLVASIFIIGAPVLLFYLKSMQYFSLFEGRLIESLLGERMPRRANYMQQPESLSVFQRIKLQLGRKQAWTSALYLGLKLPIGILTFVINVIPVCLSVGLILTPVFDPMIHSINPAYQIDLKLYWLPLTLPLGLCCLILSLKLTKYLTKIQANLAKSMLVKAYS